MGQGGGLKMHVYDVLSKPLVTEKNAQLQALGKYVFEVAPKANKHQIKQAVETAFKVNVTAVNVITVPGKQRRIGRQQVLTQSWKKAIVTLKPGDKIELFEGV
jgi:large subunit ribosomal protein L23